MEIDKCSVSVNVSENKKQFRANEINRTKSHCTRPVRRGGEIESTGSQNGHSCS